jgi:TonB-dependent starch-binding outer membrane protein SusC
MKKLLEHVGQFYPRIKKLLLIMRLSVLLILIAVFSSAASVYSQETKLTLKMENARIAEVFDAIEEQSEFIFFYNRDYFDDNRIVTVDFKDKKIDEVLKELFKGQSVEYEIFDRNIVIKVPNTYTDFARRVYQQQRTVSGKVTDTGGEPLPGVNILVKGTTQGTVTNSNGEYSIADLPEDVTLVFSFVGMRTQEVVVGNQTSIDVTMKVDVVGIEEVVAIGYGEAQRSDLTGAITQIRTDELKKFSPSNVSDLLRTRVAGLNVGYSTSAKGNSSYQIRGETTLTAGANPLIVLDGVIYNGDISDINPNDIERMDVLKDASSAAVYGSRATNGVIVITTTRTGLTDKPTITFNSNLGVATTAKRLSSYDADEFLQWRSDLYKSVFYLTVPSRDWSPFDDPRTIDSQYLDEWLKYHNTSEDKMVDSWLSSLRLTGIEMINYKDGLTQDWEDHIFQNGLRQDYNISLSGKSENFTYYYSLGYMKNEALTIGDEFSTIRSRVNIEGQVAKFIKVGLNTQFSYRDESSIPALSDEYFKLTPYSSYYSDDGEKLRYRPNDDIQSVHPFHIAYYRQRELEYFTLFTKLYSILELPFGISYTINYTPHMRFNHNYVHNSSEHPVWVNYGGSASRSNSILREWQIDNIIHWNHILLDVHKFNVTLLANVEKKRYNSDSMSNRDFSPNDYLGYHNMNIGSLPQLSSNDNVETADALMARLNYGYDNRYLLTLSVRRDGSSLFGYSNPRATFPAAALGWVVSEEDFFSSSVIDYLKIRASWGANGNRNIANYAALSKIATGKALNADQSGSAHTISTLSITTMENKNLKWEQTESFNLGIDFNLFDGVLAGLVEGYTMSTTDVLVNRELPSLTGFDRVYANLGEVINKGLEINLNSTNIKSNNFDWHTNFIFSLNRNKINSIVGDKFDVYDDKGNIIGQKEPDDIANNWFIGYGKDIIWDYKILGTWKVGEEDEADEWNQVPGDFRLEDVNGDGMLTNKDKHFLGYREPRFRWTMTNNFDLYKNWEASVIIYSLWGHMGAFNQAKHDNHIEDRRNTWKIQYWTPENPTDKYARLRSAPAKGVGYSAWFEKSYIRVENIAVAYRLPQSFLTPTFIQTCRVSFNIRNAALWAPDWKYGDPEDINRTQRIFSLGLNMTL